MSILRKKAELINLKLIYMESLWDFLLKKKHRSTFKQMFISTFLEYSIPAKY